MSALGLAVASVRSRPSAFVGSFVALLFGAVVTIACGALLQTGLTASLPPVKYAGAPVVVAARASAEVTLPVPGEGPETTRVTLPERARVDLALAERIATLPGVAAAVPELSFPVTTPDGPSTVGALADRSPAPGGLLAGADTPYRSGDRLTVTTPTGERTYRVLGTLPDRTGLWLDPAEAARAAGHPGRVDAVTVQPKPGVPTAELASQVRTVAGPAEVLTGDDRTTAEQPRLTDTRELLTALGGSFGGITAMTAVFVVLGTVALATGQRSREFALLRAVGATPGQIRRTVATEAALLAPLAGALAVLPGFALARCWFGQMTDRGMVAEGVRLSTGPIPVLAAVGAGLLSALFGGWLAARRPAKLRPGLALSESAAERPRLGTVRLLFGLLALAGGVALAGVAAHLGGADAANTALGVVMCLLLAVGLLGPLLARISASVLGWPLRLRGAAASLAADNTRANARRLASAITPIVMVTAFCGTLLFLQSTLTHAAGDQARRGLVADHVVSSTGAGLSPELASRAAALPGVGAAVGVLDTAVAFRAGDTPATATALGLSGDPASYAKVLDLGLRSGDLAGLARPGTVALATSVAEELGVTVGQQASLWLGDGTPVTPTVVATYERGLGLGEAVLPRTDLAAHVTTGYDARLLVRAADGADRAAVARELTGLGAVTVTDAAEHGAQADRDREASGWANTVMAAVLGGFAAVAAANTLVMTVLDRRRELGLLRLAGSTRRQVRGMLRWESLLVASSGLLLGGTIAWITLLPIARGLTGGSPHVPATLALPLAAAVILLALTATALPGRALLRSARRG
ncbi:FtsX-like permease family protein [Kitasatospora sp. NPDC096147]|uniref:ABC transporter permease n=1 Tax=Kitasatospora sp. NPDC096147 TaxID=3364093 RepID=UPI00382F0852